MAQAERLISLLGKFALLLGGTLVLFASLTAVTALGTRLVGEHRLRRWAGGNSVTAPLKGLVFGIVTPFCSWSAIPVLLSLLRSRVRTSAVAAFFLASPVLDPVLVVALGWLFGFWVAVWFTVFLSVTSIVIAHLAERLHLERLVHPRVFASDTRTSDQDQPSPAAGRTHDVPWEGWHREATQAVRLALRQMRQLLVPLAITCAVGVAMADHAPTDLIARLAGSGAPLAVPAAAVLGAPLYLPTEALAPLGWALREAGVGVGATFAFMITAASLSLPELVLLTRVFRPRLLVATVAAITLLAVVGASAVPLIPH
ncbi:MAG: hypothetical protein GEV10_14775 [Streptosporangiales bacterium]|nr:hypothetical protein [Streptosporangiales bacterium]